MKTVNVKYADFFNNNIVTVQMVRELAAKALNMTQDAIEKLASQQLRKPSGNGRKGSNGATDVPEAKLRTVVLQKLQQPNDYVENFSHGNSFDFEFECFADEQPEPDINAAGQNNAKRQRATRQGSKLSGAYIVVRKDGLRCTQESDPEKYALWQFVWNCKTFEEYFATAPAKAVTRTQRIITASSEMLWAIKCGWVKPVAQQ